MAFTLKVYKATQKSRVKKNNPAQLAQSTAAPTVPAGPKNSNGPKGGSAKSSVPANRTYKKTVNSIKPKVSKVTKASLRPKATYQAGAAFAPRGNAAITATPGVNNISNNAGRKRSLRLNYRSLRSK